MKELKSIGAMATELLTMQASLTLAVHKGLNEVATSIQRTAKEEIGTYQPAVSPFPGWPQLAEATQAQRVRMGFSPNDPGLRDGTMRDSIVKEVGLTEAVVASDDQNLVYFELGTDKQPPRPVLGPAVVRNHTKIMKTMGSAVVSGMLGGAAIPGNLGYDHDV